MRTETINIYKFDELSKETQQKAIENYRSKYQGVYYAWDNENQDTLKTFLDLFLAEVKRHGNVKTNYDHGLTGLRLKKWIINNFWTCIYKPKYYSKYIKNENKYRSRYSKIQWEWDNCSLTGYCMDNDIIQPLIDYIRTPKNDSYELDDVLTWCYEAFQRSVEKDHEWQDSDEYIIEEINTNDYEFHEDGTMI